MAETDLNLLVKGINEFTKYLHQKLGIPNENDIFSPSSIYSFLLLISQDPYWFHTMPFYTSTLFISDINRAAAYYKNIFGAFSSVNDLLFGNISYVKPYCKVQDIFKDRLRHNFATEINFLDFSKREIASGDPSEPINAWISDKTNQKITHFSDLKGDINLALLNAMHLKSSWADPFSPEETVPAKFYLNEQNTIEVQMMRRKSEFYYKNNTHDAQVLKLPFAGNNVSLVVILPKKGTNISVLEKTLGFRDMTQLTVDMIKSEVDVSLPKFKINGALEVTNYLKQIKQDIFTANLIGMIEDEELNFSEMHQKVFLNVNEAGAEAATGTISTLTKTPSQKVVPNHGIEVYESKIVSEISNRFAKTNVVWRVKNGNTVARNADFKVVLTETAFITEFVMEIDGKSYKSFIQEKQDARNIFSKAIFHGQSAGLVEASTRNSTEFTVSINLESDSVAVFSLTYEEMLQRVHDRYELVLNICPGQIVNDLNIEVRINESRPLKFVKTPPLRSGNDIRTTQYDKYLDPQSDIKMLNSRTASVKFHPNSTRQKSMANCLGEKTTEGLSGQFVVQYDVERDPINGEVLLQDGYFVHFFAPNDLDPLAKHMIFVLDTSGSMAGRKLDQLKDAMTNILSDLREEDMLSIIEFNSDVIVWDINLKKITGLSVSSIKDFKNPFAYLQKHILADPQRVSDSIIKKAKDVIQDIAACGQTFMIGGLETALHLVKTGQELNENKEEKLQPIIVFLTDGEPNVGINIKSQIVYLITCLNMEDNVPIFSLSFGDSADKSFLRKLSHKNFGFSRHIYEAADASLQLQEFYKQISSPLLHDINFKYDAKVEEVTRMHFPLYFRGSELVVAGRCEESIFPTYIGCCGPHGPITVTSSAERPVTSLERLWAYLTVRQLLDERDSAKDPAVLTRKAVNLALKYSFVTDVTSLIVVRPNTETTTCGIFAENAVLEKIDCSTPRKQRDLSFGSSRLSADVASFGPQTLQGFAKAEHIAKLVSQSRSRKTTGQQPCSFGSSFGLPTNAGTTSASNTFEDLAQLGYSQPSNIKAQQQFSFGSTSLSTNAETTPASNSFGASNIAAQQQFSFGRAFGLPTNTETTAASNLFGASNIAAQQQFSFGSASLPTNAETTAASNLFGASNIAADQFSFGRGFGLPTNTETTAASNPFGASNIAAEQQFSFGSGFSLPTTNVETTAASNQFGAGGITTNRPALFGGGFRTTGASRKPFKSGGGFNSPSKQETPVVSDKLEDESAEKHTEEFIADRPFLVLLQLEIDNTTLILFQGRVYRP